MSGTCKRESGIEHATVIQTVLDACRRKEDVTRARIISVASDGESRRGLALEHLFMSQQIGPSSPIYAMLRGLKLFNLSCGVDDITLDKDPKHVMKRLRNVALRKSGFVVHGTHVTPAQLRHHLSAAGASRAHLDSILNPQDKQDVALMFTLLRDIWSLPAPLPSDLPGFAATRTALRTFGRLCYYIIMPYLQVDMSLSEQLESLSAAAHLALDFFTFGDGSEGCLSARFLLDLMHMIKNAYVCVAKAKATDPDSSFWIILLGTDRLETAFGILRTIVGNDANVDTLQLGTRLSHVVECANIFAAHPEWDRGPRRLRLSPLSASGEVSRDADHITPLAWRGDVTVRTVVLQTCWQRGRKLVETEFASSGISARLQKIDNTPGANILAPLGQKLDPTADVDDDIDDAVDSPATQSANGPVDREMDIEDLVGAEECSAQATFSATVVVGTKKVPVYKARYLREVMDPRAADSTDRLKRIAKISRYTTTDESSTYIDDPTALGAGSLCVDDPIATIVICEKRMFYTVGQVISLESNGRAVQLISSDLLPEATVTVRFRILHLVEFHDDDGAVTDEWRWNLRYGSSHTTLGRLVEPLDPAVVVLEPGKTTFSFKTDDLRTLAIAMFDKITSADMVRVPNVKRTDMFPYRSGDYACFACEFEGRDTSDTLSERYCTRCDPPFELDWNDAPRVIAHMSCHILFDRGVQRQSEPCGFCLSPGPLCTFHLRKGKGADSGFQVDFRQGKSHGCQRASPFKYAFASKSTAHSPCSNVPIVCPRCPPGQPAIWRYNLEAHICRVHPSARLSDFKELYELSGSELDGMRALWNARKSTRRASRKAAATPLKISEEHRAVVPISNPDSQVQAALIFDEDSDTEDLAAGVADDDSDSSHSESDADAGYDSESDASAMAQDTASTFVGHQAVDNDETATKTPVVVAASSIETSGTINTPVPDADDQLGRGRRTKKRQRLARDVCICDVPVTDEEIKVPSKVIQCASTLCESQWYHMECFNFTYKPKNWKCDSCEELEKRRKRRK